MLAWYVGNGTLSIINFFFGLNGEQTYVFRDDNFLKLLPSYLFLVANRLPEELLEAIHAQLINAHRRPEIIFCFILIIVHKGRSINLPSAVVRTRIRLESCGFDSQHGLL